MPGQQVVEQFPHIGDVPFWTHAEAMAIVDSSPDNDPRKDEAILATTPSKLFRDIKDQLLSAPRPSTVPEALSFKEPYKEFADYIQMPLLFEGAVEVTIGNNGTNAATKLLTERQRRLQSRSLASRLLTAGSDFQQQRELERATKLLRVVRNVAVADIVKGRYTTEGPFWKALFVKLNGSA